MIFPKSWISPVKWSQSCWGNSARARSAVWKAWTIFGRLVSGSDSSIKSLSFSRATRAFIRRWSNFSQLFWRSIDLKKSKHFCHKIDKIWFDLGQTSLCDLFILNFFSYQPFRKLLCLHVWSIQLLRLTW